MSHIVTHPDNVKKLEMALIKERARLRFQTMDDYGNEALLYRIPRLEIRSNQHMERDHPSGNYRVLATGKVMPKAEFRLQEGRFVAYGAEDIPHLLMRGVIHELREPLFIHINDDMERFQIRS